MIQGLEQLSEIERQALMVIDDSEKNAEDISELSSLNIDSARRAIAWLSEKGFVKINEKPRTVLSLTEKGKISLEKGMPENIFLEALEKLNGEATFDELQKESNLDKKEFTAALGINKKNVFIIIAQGRISLTGVAKEQETFDLRNSLRDVVDGNKVKKEIALDLLQRGLIERKEIVERTVSINQKGIDAQKLLKDKKIKRVYDVEAPVPRILAGKKQPYMQFVQKLRQKMVNLGFEEMKPQLIVPEFYNFDVLYQPQNHPARTWTDTYQLKKPAFGKLNNKKAVEGIRAAHENGGKSKSKGWRYKWDPKIASKLMPTAHGTTFDAMELCKPCKVPGKYFVIARTFRPDVLDATHLVEFNQMDGFIIGEKLNFRHLLGMLELLATEVAGATKIRFFPDYYPFTEPSVQLSAYKPGFGWVEFAGAGIFRPEMLENLGYGKNVRAIAWGAGIDRLAMMKLGITDIRNLFSQDLNYLREAQGVR